MEGHVAWGLPGPHETLAPVKLAEYKYEKAPHPGPYLPSLLLRCFREDKMKFTIVFAGLLGVFLAPAIADYNINVSDDDNSAGSGQQTVSVNNEHNVANIDNNNGENPWNSVWDYGSGFAATRLFHKKSCIVYKMNKDAVPSIQALDALIKEKKVKIKGKGAGELSRKGLMYSINPSKVDDLNKFGNNITTMCRGVPTYLAEEITGASLFYYSEKCFNTNILWILNISFCGETVEN
ncbi:gastrokine-1 [Cynocephalus volans]|uniref:gastrokine-1 n=1 Tax=Cynocephalus volans TaxID=110931 RepID=UPI002FCA97C8